MTNRLAHSDIVYGKKAEDLVADEVAIQERMWGLSNERPDVKDNQLIDAAKAQLALVLHIEEGMREDRATALALLDHYPNDPRWGGLRSYGSTIANLVVASAFIRAEIKRRLVLGEDQTRTPRNAAYSGTQPVVSSEIALAEHKSEAKVPRRSKSDRS
jgi:hypothetical protein